MLYVGQCKGMQRGRLECKGDVLFAIQAIANKKIQLNYLSGLE
ncbi:hypothetical protein UF75_2439 [Desulfosporosinus sp. I2]|nr:hypothetical protein UF75_2439 [Desulfosporosinus sp. I2]